MHLLAELFFRRSLNRRRALAALQTARPHHVSVAQSQVSFIRVRLHTQPTRQTSTVPTRYAASLSTATRTIAMRSTQQQQRQLARQPLPQHRLQLPQKYSRPRQHQQQQLSDRFHLNWPHQNSCCFYLL